MKQQTESRVVPKSTTKKSGRCSLPGLCLPARREQSAVCVEGEKGTRGHTISPALLVLARTDGVRVCWCKLVPGFSRRLRGIMNLAGICRLKSWTLAAGAVPVIYSFVHEYFVFQFVREFLVYWKHSNEMFANNNLTFIVLDHKCHSFATLDWQLLAR